MTDTCCCGHVLDEHDRGVECTIGGCLCVHYEEDVGDAAEEGGEA